MENLGYIGTLMKYIYALNKIVTGFDWDIGWSFGGRVLVKLLKPISLTFLIILLGASVIGAVVSSSSTVPFPLAFDWEVYSSVEVPWATSDNSVPLFISDTTSLETTSLVQFNSSVDFKLVIVNSPNLFPTICCSIIIYPEIFSSNTQIISTFPTGALGIVHSVI